LSLGGTLQVTAAKKPHRSAFASIHVNVTAHAIDAAGQWIACAGKPTPRCQTTLHTGTIMSLNELTTTWAPRLLSVLRIMSALLFMQHGTAKFLTIPQMDQFAKLQAYSPSWFAGLFELIGGALLLIGLFTRPVAFVLSGVMAAAYFMAHAPRAFFPIVNAGELAALYCFVFLYIAFAGGGAWSVDALRKKS
jgi:putative oxidoreductase